MNNNLPIYDVIDDIRSTLLQNNTLVLEAPPGAGKSTVVPISLLDEPWLEDKKIIMLEPRRVAARAVATRMAHSLGEEVGKRVGYRVRMESCVSKETKIEVVTEAILTRMLQNDQSLEDVALVIFDEFHERSIHTDLSLALSLQVQGFLRDDLKLLIMSATLDSAKLLQMLGTVPLITSKGRTYEIEYVYLPLNIKQPDYKTIHTLVTDTIINSIANDSGDILVFLAGAKDILKVQELLKSKPCNSDIEVLPLYSSLSKKEQDRAISKSNSSEKRKVILSTNIAQTSLTIEGVKVVVDTGLEKLSSFDHSNDMDSLNLSFISKDSATQRAGRAGRLSNGKCYRLWHEKKILQDSTTPEILRADLGNLVLETALWGVDDIKELKFLDYPSKDILSDTKKTLKTIQMLDKSFKISDYGKSSIKLGVHPRYSFMILQSNKLGLGFEACILTAILEESHRFRNYNDIYDIYIDLEKYKDIIKRAEYFFGKLKKIEKIIQKDKKLSRELIGIMLLYAYPNRLVRQREQNSGNYKLSNGKGAVLDIQSSLFNEKFLVVPNLNTSDGRSYISLASVVNRSDILEHFPLLVREQKEVSYNKETKKFNVKAIKSFLSLQIDSKSLDNSDLDFKELILGVIAKEGLSVLQWDKKAVDLKQRINLVNSRLSDTGLPDFSDEKLLEDIEVWLSPYLDNIKSIKELESLQLYDILSAQIPWDMQKELDTLAPSHIKVPSGSNIKIDYSDINVPVLAVRIQEMFGMQTTPRILKEKLPLQIHLLTPAYRPIQITYDLESFWKNSYQEVAKELKGKYKKHYWPEDPFQAVATNKTKKHMDKNGK